MNEQGIHQLQDIKSSTTKTTESITYDDKQDQQSFYDILSNDNNSDSMTAPNIQINDASHSKNSNSQSLIRTTNNKHFTNLQIVNNISTKSIPYNTTKYRSKYRYLNKRNNNYPYPYSTSASASASVSTSVFVSTSDDDQESVIDDEKIERKKYSPKRRNTWTVPHKNDLINQFIAKHFNTERGIAHITKISKICHGHNTYSKMSKDELLKRGRILYDRANSLISNKNARKRAVSSFVECLNIIYLLYNCNSTLLLSTIEKNNIIGQHMNIVLNLGLLYTETENTLSQLGSALKMYNEAQLLYELDENRFKNLKAYILRGMADVYIKQEEYLTAFGLLEEAFLLASHDKEAIYHILCTKGRALFDAKQLHSAAQIFNKAILLLLQIQKNKAKPYDLYDRDLYRNTALCYKCIAREFCSVVYINSTKTYAVKNTQKSMQFWDKSAKAYHQTVKIVKHLFTTHSNEYVQALYEWSDVLCTKGDYNKSYHIYQNIQSLFQQFDTETQKQHQTIIEKTKQMIQTLRPYISDNTL